MFFAYDVCDVDPYNEAAVAIAVRPSRHGGPAELDFLSSVRNATTYGHSLALPVNTEIARVRGLHGYGLPKWRTDIELTLDDAIFSGRVANDRGDTDIVVEFGRAAADHARVGRKVSTTIALSVEVMASGQLALNMPVPTSID